MERLADLTRQAVRKETPFIRSILALAQAKGDPDQAAMIARNKWPEMPDTVTEIKAAIAPLSTVNTSPLHRHRRACVLRSRAPAHHPGPLGRSAFRPVRRADCGSNRRWHRRLGGRCIGDAGGETFVVPEDTQMLFSQLIEVAGILQIDGALIGVD